MLLGQQAQLLEPEAGILGLLWDARFEMRVMSREGYAVEMFEELLEEQEVE